jgi:heptose I phosphotransferase
VADRWNLSFPLNVFYHPTLMPNRGAGWDKIESDDGIWYCVASLRTALEAIGLKTFADWMALQSIDYREVSMRPRRPVVALEIPGVSEDLFLKRNLDSSRPKTLLETLGIETAHSEAVRELDKLEAFSSAGVPVPEPVAWGEGDWKGAPGASFVATKDLLAIPLERYLFHHWSPPLGREAVIDKRATLTDLARLTRRMHDAGLVHRDYYFGHIFVSERSGEGESRLSVIDVQRASRRPRWWIRPRIKDLASLHFSADPKYIRPADRLRFLKDYWQVEQFSPWKRFQIAWILKKADRIRRHTEKALGIPYSEYFKNKYY